MSNQRVLYLPSDKLELRGYNGNLIPEPATIETLMKTLAESSQPVIMSGEELSIPVRQRNCLNS
ncbi:hypothetical protein [Paenibacillus sp. FSL H7-0331]|uniref:hypothetical protein n=1 Tax=Paenibacillus sp. FSL H7-0331 TaxID=1920421 RepID=UPI0021160829|nr:hypothetical protein [Paenibacillus sp. FSL H7-0331]